MIFETSTTPLLHLRHEYGPATFAESGTAHPVRASVDLLNAGGTRNTTYDNLGQIDVASGGPPAGPGAWTQTYVFDGRGNRTAVAATGELTMGRGAPADGQTPLIYNDDNQLTSTADHGFLYDMAGNLIYGEFGSVDYATENGGYVYDTAGRLAWAELDVWREVFVVGFVYGADTRLLATVTLKPGYSIEDLGGNGSVSAGSPAETDPELDCVGDLPRVGRRPDRRRLHRNWTQSRRHAALVGRVVLLGQPTALDAYPARREQRAATLPSPRADRNRLVSGPDPTGTGYLHLDHDPLPFGSSLWRDGGAARTFTNYRRNAARIDYAANRFYHPRLGRFLQPDPLGPAAFAPTSPANLNLYTYCGNDPVGRTDPTRTPGHHGHDEHSKITLLSRRWSLRDRGMVGVRVHLQSRDFPSPPATKVVAVVAPTAADARGLTGEPQEGP